MTCGYVVASVQLAVPLWAQHEQQMSITAKQFALGPLQQMRVRTVAGTTYYMRSGARITGKVHERFMLIDGNRVATGSYRYGAVGPPT